MKRPFSPALMLTVLCFSATSLFGLVPGSPCVPVEVAKERPAIDNDWRGVWKTNWGDLTICVIGDRFEGEYGGGNIIEGKIDPAKPHVLSGGWVHAGGARTGRMIFTMTAPGKFLGAWSWGDRDPSGELAGPWAGRLAMLDDLADELKIDKEVPAVELKGEAVGKAVRSDKHGDQLHQVFQLTNTSGKTVYVYGYSKDSPFIQPSTRNPDTGEWEERFLGFCSTGAALYPVAPGEGFVATVTIGREHADREIAIGLTVSADPAGEGRQTCRVAGLRAQL